jgi:hypothetical protein
MTYRELLKEIQSLPEDRLDYSVKVYDPYVKGYISVVHIHKVENENQHPTNSKFLLDEGELYMVLKG